MKCQNCSKRHVGCHAQCQYYVVNKVIKMYKNQKRIEQFDNEFSATQYKIHTHKLRKQLKGYRM